MSPLRSVLPMIFFLWPNNSSTPISRPDGDTAPSSLGPSERQPLRPPDSGDRARAQEGREGCEIVATLGSLQSLYSLAAGCRCGASAGACSRGALAGTQRTPAFSVRCPIRALNSPTWTAVRQRPCLLSQQPRSISFSPALPVCWPARLPVCLLACICGTHLFHYPGLACVLSAW